MSLFPSVKQVTKKDENQEETKDDSWLTNNSFGAASSSFLKYSKYHSQEDDISKNKSFEEVFQLAYQKREIPMQTNQLIESDTESSSDNSSKEDLPKKIPQVTSSVRSSQDLYFIDKKGDKNFFYFSRPFNCKPPRYRRITTQCLGLPKHLMIEFKKKKKKRRRYETSLDRYFHLQDEDMQKEDEERSNEVKRLNETLGSNPEDIDSWMKLVDLQDQDRSCRNKTFIAEKKISILDRAIEENNKVISLKLKKLQIMDSVAKGTERDWENLAFYHSDSIEAWTAYIDHIKTNHQFTVRKVLNIYAKCFESMTSHARLAEQKLSQLLSPSVFEDRKIEMFGQMVHFLLEAGHDEKCFVLLGLMVEINVVMMTRGDADIDDVRGFCDEGIPLIGEPDAKGFESWLKKYEKGGWKDQEDPVDEDEEEDEDVDEEKSEAENWLDLELIRSYRHFLPWRSSEDCEDPKRKVTFDQIRKLLFFVTSAKSKIALVLLYLRFMGFEPQHRDGSRFHFLHPCHILHPCYNFSFRFITSSSICDLKRCLHRSHLSNTRHQIITRFFHLLIHISRSDPHLFSQISMLHLDYRISCIQSSKSDSVKRKSGKKARSIAKRSLQIQPDNIELWLRLAQIEYECGRLEDGRKVVTNSLVMLPHCCLRTASSFAMFAWKKDPERVKRILVGLGDGKKFEFYLKDSTKVSSSVVLKSSRWLVKKCDDLIGCYEKMVTSGGDMKEFGQWLVCALVNGFLISSSIEKDLAPALQKIKSLHSQNYIQATNDLKMIQTLLVDLKESLVTEDSYKKTKSQIEFQEAVLNGLGFFPASSVFATRLCEMKARSAISWHTLNYFDIHSLPPASGEQMKNLVIRFVIFTMKCEMSRNERRSPYRLINVIEKGLKQHPHSILLWRMLLKNHPHPERVFPRALAACPWSKEIALDCVRVHPESVEEVIKQMKEGGIRIRTPLEEVRLLLSLC